MTARSERLLTALETELTNVSKLEHVLARTRVVLREHATRLRLGEDAEIVMTGLRFNVPAETGLALLERVDPVLSPGSVAGAADDIAWLDGGDHGMSITGASGSQTYRKQTAQQQPQSLRTPFI